MRKSFLTVIVISGLVFAGCSIAALVKFVRQYKTTANRQATATAGVTVFTVLQAHGAHNDKVRSAFGQNATLTYYSNTSTGPQFLVERKLSFATDGSIIRFDKTTLNRTDSFLCDGKTTVRTTFDAGTQLGSKVLDHYEAAGIKFQVATFGLLPILKRLSNTSTQVVYLGVTSKGQRFEVKTAKGPWHFYVDSTNLIVRVEADDINITYSDYRTVYGLNLPAYQQVKKGNKLLYEIKFETPDFNPAFPPDLFKSEFAYIA
jgi:hypothetical protein